MDRAESKYSNTARRMDRAFLDLLDRKDFAYITVKELCQAAGVNRSTFYLHYETMGDLLSESVEAIMSEFLDYMQRDTGEFIRKLRDCPREELYLITPEYLTPYLSFIREHQRLMQTALARAATLGLENSYAGLLRHVIGPILDRYGVQEADRGYLMAFYMKGLMAVIEQWLKNDCRDSVERIAGLMQKFVKEP